jgi:hypothetical protein
VAKRRKRPSAASALFFSQNNYGPASVHLWKKLPLHLLQPKYNEYTKYYLTFHAINYSCGPFYHLVAISSFLPPPAKHEGIIILWDNLRVSITYTPHPKHLGEG